MNLVEMLRKRAGFGAVVSAMSEVLSGFVATSAEVVENAGRSGSSTKSSPILPIPSAYSGGQTVPTSGMGVMSAVLRRVTDSTLSAVIATIIGDSPWVTSRTMNRVSPVVSPPPHAKGHTQIGQRHDRPAHIDKTRRKPVRRGNACHRHGFKISRRISVGIASRSLPQGAR